MNQLRIKQSNDTPQLSFEEWLKYVNFGGMYTPKPKLFNGNEFDTSKFLNEGGVKKYVKTFLNKILVRI